MKNWIVILFVFVQIQAYGQPYPKIKPELVYEFSVAKAGGGISIDHTGGMPGRLAFSEKGTPYILDGDKKIHTLNSKFQIVDTLQIKNQPHYLGRFWKTKSGFLFNASDMSGGRFGYVDTTGEWWIETGEREPLLFPTSNGVLISYTSDTLWTEARQYSELSKTYKVEDLIKTGQVETVLGKGFSLPDTTKIFYNGLRYEALGAREFLEKGELSVVMDKPFSAWIQEQIVKKRIFWGGWSLGRDLNGNSFSQDVGIRYDVVSKDGKYMAHYSVDWESVAPKEYLKIPSEQRYIVTSYLALNPVNGRLYALVGFAYGYKFRNYMKNKIYLYTVPKEW